MSEPTREERTEAAANIIREWVVDPSKGGPREMLDAALEAAGMDSLLAERDRLREALGVAADDLDKAANQFDGLYQGILCQYVESGAIPGTNGRKFAEKAARARAVLGEPVPEESNDG